MRFHVAVAPTRFTLAALCTGWLLLSIGCRSDELQGPAQGPEGSRKPALAVAPTNGLVGEWKLDETNGTVANDTKNNFDATVFGGAAFVPGKIGNALNLNNGTSGTGGKYAQMPSNTTLDNLNEANYTVSAWFQPASQPPNTGVPDRLWAVVAKGSPAMGIFYNDAGKFLARHQLTGPGGTIGEQAAGATVYPTGAWSHIVSTVSETTGKLKIYLNGVLQDEASFDPATTMPFDYGSAAFQIGKSGSQWAADGKVDQVRIYNRELSAAEVDSLFHETSGALGIPFGLTGIRPDSAFTDSRWTGGVKFVASMPVLVDQLRAARAKSPKLHMWYNIVSGNEEDFFTSSTDHSFSLPAWKTRLDNNVRGSGFNADGSSPWHDSVRTFIQDGTFQGTILLDDLQNFNPDPTFTQIEEMAEHMKLRFPTLVTAARVEPTFLKAQAGTRTYNQLDVGWAQYKENKGPVATYRNNEIAAASAVKLGLVLGINITKGRGPFSGPESGTDILPDSLRSWGDTLLAPGASDYACGFTMYDVRYAYLSHSYMTELSNLAKNHVAAPCRRR